MVSGSIPGVRLSAGPHKKFTSIHTRRSAQKKCNMYANTIQSVYLPGVFRIIIIIITAVDIKRGKINTKSIVQNIRLGNVFVFTNR